MDPHEQRVVEDEKDLSSKLGRVRDFFATGIFLDLLPDEQSLLRSQSLAMVQYLECLRQRIAGFSIR